MEAYTCQHCRTRGHLTDCTGAVEAASKAMDEGPRTLLVFSYDSQEGRIVMAKVVTIPRPASTLIAAY